MPRWTKINIRRQPAVDVTFAKAVAMVVLAFNNNIAVDVYGAVGSDLGLLVAHVRHG